jgi:bifunctional isochorismate lyase/aryl carrier protein
MSIIKEEYFTPGTIQGKSRELLASVMTLREKHAGQVLEIHKAALLVLDMQRYFLDPSVHAYIPSGPAILPGILRLVRAFEEKKRPVILTRHLNSIAKAGLMVKWWKDLIREESPFSQVTPELKSPGRIVIHKNQYDAFYETSLEAILRDAQVEQVVISGVMTHLCCETTARSAFMRGFEVFVAIDGMATYNHAFHQAALLNLSHGFAYPMLVDEIEELICEAG